MRASPLHLSNARAMCAGLLALALLSGCVSSDGIFAANECTPPPAGPAPDATPADSSAIIDSLKSPPATPRGGEACPAPNR